MGTIKKHKLVILPILAMGLFVTVACASFSAKTKINMGQFVKELMIIDVKGNTMQSAIWLPFEFNVQASVSGGKSVDEAEKDFAMLKSYLIFIVQSSVENSDGLQRYASESEIKNRAVLSSNTAAYVKPMANVPAELAGRIEAIKSIMADTAQSKANMHVLVFPFKNSAGKTIVRASNRDKLVLKLRSSGKFSKAEFTWRTPFEAITKGGYCSGCNEKVKAKWHHCPWCGTKL